ncbi:MAG: caspase family protein [Planctomycetota bacterium]|nr:MAG: caspase family protein [Planctomycetota bacterium]
MEKMAKGSALLVGLKEVDPACYDGWNGKSGCWGCELDADNMERLLRPLGYEVKMLKTAEATRDRILAGLYRASENRAAGDIFVFYYSGHGGQQPDKDGDEVDGKDETLVAYDREVIDDKVHEALGRFRKGVRIVMISDSCNSGTNYRGWRDVPLDMEATFRPVARRTQTQIKMQAQLIHLGGCRDGFGSAGYQSGGAFTMALCEAWQGGQFRGTFEKLHGEICHRISGRQRPQYSKYGPVSAAFENQQAFAV